MVFNQIVPHTLPNTLYYITHWITNLTCIWHIIFESTCSRHTSLYTLLYHSLKYKSTMCLTHGFNQLVPQILPNTLYYSTHWFTNLTGFWLIILESTCSRHTSLYTVLYYSLKYQSNMCLTHGFQSASSTNTSQYFVL